MNMKLNALLLASLALTACGGGSNSSPSAGGNTGGNTGGSNNDFTVTVAVTGAGDVSRSEQTLSSGDSFKFTVTPDALMLTKSVSSDSCELEVVGDDIYVNNVTESCTVNVSFDDCTDCYTADDLVLDYDTYRPVMERNCVRGGLVATGSDNVPWHNLCQAAETLATMLEYNSVVVDELQTQGAITAVFGPDEGVCDLPYFDFIEGQPQCDTAEGGLGGTSEHPVTACSAKTLSATNDAFGRGEEDGENTCVHELAHTIMNVAIDEQTRNDIVDRYHDILNEGGDLWIRDNGERAFALQNEDELFAEVTQSYFNANVAIDAFNHVGVNGADELADYDPITFELVDRIFMQTADLK
ncbi:MAG: hypothetical protein WEA82_06615 [Idiomarina sp.]